MSPIYTRVHSSPESHSRGAASLRRSEGCARKRCPSPDLVGSTFRFRIHSSHTRRPQQCRFQLTQGPRPRQSFLAHPSQIEGMRHPLGVRRSRIVTCGVVLFPGAATSLPQITPVETGPKDTNELRVELAKWYHPAAPPVKRVPRKNEDRERVRHPPEGRLTRQLERNGLTSEGTSEVTPEGAGEEAPTIRPVMPEGER